MLLFVNILNFKVLIFSINIQYVCYWQARGGRFESYVLYKQNQALQRCKAFLFNSKRTFRVYFYNFRRNYNLLISLNILSYGMFKDYTLPLIFYRIQLLFPRIKSGILVLIPKILMIGLLYGAQVLQVF